MRAYVYCRVSTEEQSRDDHYSLHNQEVRAKDYAKAKDWRIVQVKKDVGSGKNTERPGFQDLVSCIKKREIDLVIVYRLDRLSRNVGDIYDTIDLMNAHDVEFASITEGFDTTTAMGRAMLGFAAVLAQLTREMIAENVKDGLLRRAESGKWNGPKWNPPYGYKYVPGASLAPIPEQVKIVKEIFRWFTEDKWGTSKIARYLNNAGVHRESGKPGSGQWHQGKVWDLLQNPVYIGKIVAGEKLVDGCHERIIDDETWTMTLEMVASRRKQAPRTKASPHLLSGLARCGTCNRMLIGQKGKYKNKQGEQAFIGFRHSPNEFAGKMHCPGVYHRGDTLEEAVIAELLAIAQGPSVRDLALSTVRDKLAKTGEPLRNEAERLTARLLDLDRRFEEWARRLDEGIVDESQFRSHNQGLLEEKRKLSERLATVQTELAAETFVEVSLSEIEAVWQDLPNVWEHLEFEERREMLRILIEKISVYPDRVEMHPFHLPVRPLVTRRSGRLYVRKTRDVETTASDD